MEKTIFIFLDNLFQTSMHSLNPRSKQGDFCANINDLPDSLLLMIFSNLSYRYRCHCAMVCTRWLRVTSDFSLKISIDVSDIKLSPLHIDKLINFHCSSIVNLLIISGFCEHSVPTMSNTSVRKLKEQSSNLRKLYLFQCYLEDITVADLSTSLVHLSLRDCQVFYDRFFGWRPCSSGPHIRCLDMSGGTLLCSDDLLIFSKITTLRALYLEGCSRVNNGGIDNMVDILPQLEILDIEETEVSDEGVKTILEYGSNIKQLFIGYTTVTDNALTMVKKGKALSLEVLCIRRTSLTVNGLKKFLCMNSFDSKLILRTCWDNTVISLSNQCIVQNVTSMDAGYRCNHHKIYKCKC